MIDTNGGASSTNTMVKIGFSSGNSSTCGFSYEELDQLNLPFRNKHTICNKSKKNVTYVSYSKLVLLETPHLPWER